MSVKRLQNGDYIITIPNPLALRGTSSKTLQKPWADELIKFFEETREESCGGGGDWPPPTLELWEPEGTNGYTSVAPDGRVAVILQTLSGLWAGKWRDKNFDMWVTKKGITYTPKETYTREEIIEIFRRQAQARAQNKKD